MTEILKEKIDSTAFEALNDDLQNVTVTIRANHDGADEMEVISAGVLIEDDIYTEVQYTEIIDDSNTLVDTRIRFNADELQMSKSGAMFAEMYFRAGSSTFGYYQTPMGEMQIETITSEYALERNLDEIKLFVSYTNQINGVQATTCNMEIIIK